MGDSIDSYASAANYRGGAITTRANASLQKRQAYADAYKLEDDSREALVIAGDQMMTMRRNQTEQVGAKRSAAGASGFSASSGSNYMAEQSVAEILEMAVSNAARSATISDVNARGQAAATRRYGDTAFNVGMVQAEYQDKMARIASGIAPFLMLGQGLTMVGNMAGGSLLLGEPSRDNSENNSGK